MKERREISRPGGTVPWHGPHNRRLADTPNAFVDHKPSCCDPCSAKAKAPAPAIAAQTPSGPRIHALAIYCKGLPTLSHADAISCRADAWRHECPRGIVRDAFGLGVSAGAPRNRPFKQLDSSKSKTGNWCGRPDLNRHRPFGPTDFLTFYGFHRRAVAGPCICAFGVWTIPSP